VRKALEAASQLDIGMIAPSHGLIWTEHIPQILAAYTDWANNVADPRRALIIYDSMWGSTEKMAKAIAQAFENKGFKLKMLNLQTNHISDIMTDVMDARFIAVGSPTLNNSILPTVAAFIYYLKGLSPKQRIGLAFGSYGWGGQSVSILQQLLGDPKECGFEMLEPVKTQYIPDAAILAGITQHAEQQLNKYL
jgi:flavorubredoxin